MIKDAKTLYKSARAKLTAYIHSHNMRESVVRDRVLSLLCQLQQPFTTDELRVACAAERISKASMYNALQLFTTARIVQPFERTMGQTITEYELVLSTRPHMQFVCRNCGRKVNFNDPTIIRLVNEHKYANFTLDRFTLVVHGECKVCRKKRITQITEQQ